jgi:hypothetical protein
MNELQEIIAALGIEPNTALLVLLILFVLMIVMAILNICVLFFLARMRKETIELHKTLRILYILDTQSKNNGPDESPNHQDKLISDETSPKTKAKFKLEDEDIQKLKALGFGLE